jgi:hypothetical protein
MIKGFASVEVCLLKTKFLFKNLFCRTLVQETIKNRVSHLTDKVQVR